MEDGVKESSKKSKTADRVGWVKKSSGGLLGYWKDRYLLVCKAQLLVYENEDEQNCLETVELENYDRCQDLRALLTKKNRFILIRSPGKKVHDIKFQAKNLEEKETWIKALNEGISKGKNKVFDEVKVDTSCSLDHVTRDRVKVAQGRRRPPTRLHLKEVADSFSDGIMRLDLDAVDNGPQNIIPDTGEKETAYPPKENYKPPMPPSKPSLPDTEENAEVAVSANDSLAPEAPSPPPKILKKKMALVDKLDSHQEGCDESDEGPGESESLPSGSQEDLTKDPTKHVSKAPIPPPKILSDKMKVKWDEPAPEYKGTQESKILATSKENLHDLVEKEASKTPIPPPKILSENLRLKEGGLNSSRNSLEPMDPDAEDAGDPQKGAHLGFPENSQLSTSNENDSVFLPEGVKTANDEKLEEEEGGIDEMPAGISLVSESKHGSSSACLGQSQFRPVPAPRKPVISKARCSSVGDLLDKSSRDAVKGGPVQQLKKDHLNEMEIRLTSGREKTEMLLHQVLLGELGKDPDGNGPKATPETLLSEAVEQLRQATQVLQEMKDLGELHKEPDLPMQKENQTDLVTLYRRSVP